MSEGELIIDHRASPGLSAGWAQRLGLPPAYLGEGGLFEAAILRCAHCSTPQIKNPLRTRVRYSCALCGGKYLCDPCAAATTLPNYIHRSIDQITDMIQSGRWIASGSASAPVFSEVTDHG